MSGVLAVTTFGICFPWWGNTRISPGLFEYIEDFLGSMSHIAETLAFVVTGVLVMRRVGTTFEANDYGRAVALWAISQVCGHASPLFSQYLSRIWRSCFPSRVFSCSFAFGTGNSTFDANHPRTGSSTNWSRVRPTASTCVCLGRSQRCRSPRPCASGRVGHVHPRKSVVQDSWVSPAPRRRVR